MKPKSKKLQPHQIEDLIWILIALVIMFGIYVLLFQPQWLVQLFTYGWIIP